MSKCVTVAIDIKLLSVKEAVVVFVEWNQSIVK